MDKDYTNIGQETPRFLLNASRSYACAVVETGGRQSRSKQNSLLYYIIYCTCWINIADKKMMLSAVGLLAGEEGRKRQINQTKEKPTR